MLFELCSIILILSLLGCNIYSIKVSNDLQNQSIFLLINFIFMSLWPILHFYKTVGNINILFIIYLVDLSILTFTEYLDSVLKLGIIYGIYEHCHEIKSLGLIFGVPIIVLLGILPLHYIVYVLSNFLFIKGNILYISLMNTLVFVIFDTIIESVAINAGLYQFDSKYKVLFNVPLKNIYGRFIVDMTIFILYRFILQLFKVESNIQHINIKIYTLSIFLIMNIWYLSQIKFRNLKIASFIYLILILISLSLS